MTFWDTVPEIGSELDRVRSRIDEEVRLGGPAIEKRLSGVFHRDAKLLRPAFAILAARIQNGGRRATDRVINLAAAVEMLHVASLIHDDIVDNARSRRGGPAVHVAYGPREAVLMGDFLFARCFAAVAEFATPDNARILSAAASRIIHAEIDEYAAGPGISVRSYLRRVIGKTAILFAASFHLGASESGANAYVTQVLRRIGYNVGVGFQIVDDILDIAGDPRRMGKPEGKDLRGGVLTLPAILVSRRDERVSRAALRLMSERNRIARIIRARGVQKAVIHGGGIAAARAWASVYTARAERELSHLPAGRDTETLHASIQRLLDRTA